MPDASQSSPGRLAAREFPSAVRTAMTGESALQQATRLMEHLRKQLEELDRREANLNRQLIAFDNERRSLRLLAQQLETESAQREQQLAAREEEVLNRESACDSRTTELDSTEQQLNEVRTALEAERAELRERLEEELSAERDGLRVEREELDARAVDLESREAALEQGHVDLDKRTRLHEDHLARLRSEISAERARLERETATRRVWASEVEHVNALRLRQIRKLRSLLERREASLVSEAELVREQHDAATQDVARQREQVVQDQEQLAQAIEDHARDVERHQEMLNLQAENLEGRRLRLDRLRDELDQERQETLESRLVVDQVYSQTVHALDVAAAQERVQAARTKLFDHYRDLRESLTRRRQECEQAQRQLIERRDGFQAERDEQLQRVAEREEHLAGRQLAMANQAEDFSRRESQFAAARERWRQDRLEAERVIRTLLRELEQGGEASLERSNLKAISAADGHWGAMPVDNGDSPINELESGEDPDHESIPVAA
ncbi:hypothetical protein Pan44_05230 [Caulifigura coniformis]|uniref:Uncharacterized protein n=1 Tax=Caulifigura coniformis TaxID=2527983 RepID=A0A517S8Q5_9PLAN|nr:hypothetical protein [Caulifigura coniformis]QDT52511.1 hypothetical protein Pan44_05230 [Caulifigura coniformis]